MTCNVCEVSTRYHMSRMCKKCRTKIYNRMVRDMMRLGVPRRKSEKYIQQLLASKS